MIGKTIQKMTVSSTSRELTSSIKFSYLKNGSWKSFNGKTINFMDGIKIQETNSDFYLKYCTWNKGQNGFYPYVSSEENDYAGSDGKPVELIDIRAYDKNGTKLTSGIVVMYRVYVEGKWLPWVSNADPEYMHIVQSKYRLGGTLDTESYYAGISGKNISGIEVRVFKEGYSSGDENYTNNEINPNLRYLVGNTWRPFSKGVLSSRIDGIEIHTSSNKPYYLSYQTFNEGQSDYYPAVSSTSNDYAGSPNKAIQKLSIEVFSTSGTKMTSGVIVMYRARVEGRWLPWVSNADPEWMRSIKSKYSLDGTLDTSGAYAGINGKNIEGVEIRIFEDDTNVPGSGDFDGSETSLTLSFMKDNESNWKNFNKTVMTGDYIDGIKIQTSSSDSFYISYRTLNEGQGSYYPDVSSTENDYAGYPGKHIQRLGISVFDKNGNKLTTGVVVMYRVYVDNRWLPWVSNADPEWMRSVQSQYNLGGSLDTSASYAGIDGKNIKGVEIRVFTGQTTSGSVGDLTGNEVLPSSMRYLVGNEWHSFNRKVTASRIDGIEIKTSSDKSYYLSYQTQNEGRSYFYPAVSSTENDYAGYPNIPVQAVGIRVFTNTGVKLTAGVVVMLRTKVAGRWLPWVSNADPEWMRSVQRKYGLDGVLDTSSYYAGIIGQNIEGIEIRIFEETEIDNTPQQPSGNHKIIDVPFISQVGTYPTGCESVTAVMALRHIGNNISVNSFIDNYLDKQSFPFDPNTAFGGSPYSIYGYGCYAPVIKKALDRVLGDKDYTVKTLSYVSLSTLCSQYIDKNIPVIIWATMYMNPPYISSSWYYNGRMIDWVAPEHCLLLVGYDDNHYIFNDPLQNKQTYYNKAAVENAYAGLHKQAVVILKKNEKPDPEPKPPARYKNGAIINPVTKEVYPIYFKKNNSDDIEEELLYEYEDKPSENKPTHLVKNSFNIAKFIAGLEFDDSLSDSNHPIIGGMSGILIGGITSFNESWESLYMDIHYYKNKSTGQKKAFILCGESKYCKMFNDWNYNSPQSLKSLYSIWDGISPIIVAQWKKEVNNMAKKLYGEYKGITPSNDYEYDLEYTFDKRRKGDKYVSYIFLGKDGQMYEYAKVYDKEKIEIVVTKPKLGFDEEIDRLDIVPFINPVSKLPEDKAKFFNIINE